MLKFILRIFKGIGFLLLSLVLIMVISRYTLLTNEYELAFSNLPSEFDGFKIVMLTDLHSMSFSQHNERLLLKIKQAKPDIVVFAGDMVSSTDQDFTVFLTLAENLVVDYPVFMVVGNHEQSLPERYYTELTTKLTELGVILLNNEGVLLTKESAAIKLQGLWFNLKYYSNRGGSLFQNNPAPYFFDVATMELVIGEKDPDLFTVLLTHNPLFFETYATWGADLTLAGHLHGGMLRLPVIGGVFSPDKSYFPPYTSGLYKLDTAQLVVSRGLGNGPNSFRFLSFPEISVLTLRVK